MPAHEVVREDWPSFFNELSRKRQGALITITETDPGAGTEMEIRSLPLVGISFEEKGSESGAIEIMAGTEPDDHITHAVVRPRQVYHKTGAGLLSSEVNEDEIVEITSAENPPVTYIRFQPETVPPD